MPRRRAASRSRSAGESRPNCRRGTVERATGALAGLAGLARPVHLRTPGCQAGKNSLRHSCAEASRASAFDAKRPVLAKSSRATSWSNMSRGCPIDPALPRWGVSW